MNRMHIMQFSPAFSYFISPLDLNIPHVSLPRRDESINQNKEVNLTKQKYHMQTKVPI
jgi:hypothetical protein